MSRATLVLAAHSLTRLRAVLIGLGLVLAGFQFLLTQVAVFLMRNEAFGMLSALLPAFMRDIAGPATLMSFTGVVSLGYFHPIVIAALVGLAITIATEATGEVERRFVDLTLARPITRRQLVTRTLIVLVVSGALLVQMMSAGSSVGLACCTPAAAPRPSGDAIRALALNLGLLFWCWGGISMAVAATVRRRATAGGAAGIAALAAFLVDYLGRVWEPARLASWLSPFHYFDPIPVVAGAGLSGKNVIVLLATGLIGVGVSYVWFSRRDL